MEGATLPEGITIRRARLSDADQLPGLFDDALRLIASRFYTPAQIDAWARRAPRFQHIFETEFEARSAWVAVTETGRLLAYIDLVDDGHIDFFYARPDVTRTQVTHDLFDELLCEAHRKGITELSTEASEAAKRFFAKYGFEVTHKQDVWLEDVCLHNYRMTKPLV